MKIDYYCIKELIETKNGLYLSLACFKKIESHDQRRLSCCLPNEYIYTSFFKKNGSGHTRVNF